MQTSSSVPAPDNQTSPTNNVHPSAVADVINLFAHCGITAAAAAYQEICSDADAQAAAARWPLMTEWLVGTTEATEQIR